MTSIHAEHAMIGWTDGLTVDWGRFAWFADTQQREPDRLRRREPGLPHQKPETGIPKTRNQKPEIPKTPPPSSRGSQLRIEVYSTACLATSSPLVPPQPSRSPYPPFVPLFSLFVSHPPPLLAYTSHVPVPYSANIPTQKVGLKISLEDMNGRKEAKSSGFSTPAPMTLDSRPSK